VHVSTSRLAISGNVAFAAQRAPHVYVNTLVKAFGRLPAIRSIVVNAGSTSMPTSTIVLPVRIGVPS
jgi:hypothetical protein